MHRPPPPPHWHGFAAIAGLAVLASLTIAAGRDPPLALFVPAAAHADPPAHAAATAAQPDPSPACDRRCLVCRQPLN